jgi:hypothetical protein
MSKSMNRDYPLSETPDPGERKPYVTRREYKKARKEALKAAEEEFANRWRKVFSESNKQSSEANKAPRQKRLPRLDRLM